MIELGILTPLEHTSIQKFSRFASFWKKELVLLSVTASFLENCCSAEETSECHKV